MLEVRVNLLKNRLYLTLDRIQKNRMNQALPTLEKAARKLSPGFSCITRFVDIREPDPSDACSFENLDRLLSSYGMARVVHIGLACGNPARPLPETPSRYTATTANTMEAAEKQLDLWELSTNPAHSPRFSN